MYQGTCESGVSNNFAEQFYNCSETWINKESSKIDTTLIKVLLLTEFTISVKQFHNDLVSPVRFQIYYIKKRLN